MAMSHWNNELEFAVASARFAGDSTLAAFRAGAKADTKKDGSLVTKTDLATEQLLRDRCLSAFPADGFLGEEFGEHIGTSGRRWIADPIDGTFSFAHGVPLYGTLLALEVDGISRVGVIHMPALAETVYAAEGTGAWHLPSFETTPAPARYRPSPPIHQALACATSTDYFRSSGHGALIETLLTTFGTVRGWSDCYAHLLAATGRADIVIEPVVHLWDIAPMTIIHAEAGGVCTDWQGRATAHSGQCVAAGKPLHADVLNLLRSE